MFLEKDGVRLYYEVRGEGEPLLLIHGVMVDAWLYENTSAFLAKYFKVITYDRRGNSRSRTEAGTAFDMDAQIADVANLLDELGIEQVYIAGASAGAIIGEYFLERWPQRVKKLILYEPAMLPLLEDDGRAEKWILMMEDLIARRKYANATMEFMNSIGERDRRAPAKPKEVSMREMRNMKHFLDQEYSVFMRYRPDLEKGRQLADRIVVAVGEKGDELPYAVAAVHYAGLIGAKLLHYPGYHNLPSDLPEEFAVCLLGTLMLEP